VLLGGSPVVSQQQQIRG